MSAGAPGRTAASSSRLVVAAPMWLEALALRRGAPRLDVLRTGMGPDRAIRAARRLADTPAGAVIVAGVCGGLDPSLEPGDVVVASELRLPHGASRRLDCDALYEALAALGLRIRTGPVEGVDHVVRGAERQRLAEGGARAVDMESAWLADGAAGRPFGVVRVVADGPQHELLRPSALGHFLRALRNLSALGPGLRRWAAAVAPAAAPLESPSSSRVWHAVL